MSYGAASGFGSLSEKRYAPSIWSLGQKLKPISKNKKSPLEKLSSARDAICDQ
jgi:hypothetical protein